MIYALVIYEVIKDFKENDILNIYNDISQSLLKMNLEELNKGIWDILIKKRSSILDLTNLGFKQFYTIMQYINNFKNIDKFCIQYTLIEGCNNVNHDNMNIKN